MGSFNQGEKMFFCVGAQKAGTSWLHKFLSQYDNVYLPRIKEMHFFDSVSLPKDLVGDFWHKEFSSMCVKAINDGRYGLAHSYLERLKIGGSVDKFRRHYLDISSRYDVLGDITPAYSMLDSDGFSLMKSAFPESRIIFFMRNPVDRYWSFLRMQLKKNSEYDISKKFVDVIDKPHVNLRSDYSRTIESLLSVFDQKKVKFIFFEDLFGDQYKEKVGEIVRFLGLPEVSLDMKEVKVNSGLEMDIPNELRRYGFMRFRHVYEYLNPCSQH